MKDQFSYALYNCGSLFGFIKGDSEEDAIRNLKKSFLSSIPDLIVEEKVKFHKLYNTPFKDNSNVIGFIFW